MRVLLGLKFRVQALRFRVQALRFRVQGVGFGFLVCTLCQSVPAGSPHAAFRMGQAVDFTLYRCMAAEKGSAACGSRPSFCPAFSRTSSASTTCSTPTQALLLAHVERAEHSAQDLQAAWQAAQAEDGSDLVVGREEETGSEDEALEWRAEPELYYKTEHYGKKEHYDWPFPEERLVDVKDWAQGGELRSDITPCREANAHSPVPTMTTSPLIAWLCLLLQWWW